MKIFETLYDYIADFGIRLAGFAVVLFIGVKLIRRISNSIGNIKAFDKLDPNLRSFLKSFISIILYAVLFIICCSILGINTASFITVLASCGVAVGLGLQGALSNIAGGLMILLFHPFHVGDFVEASGVSGVVKEISVFYTRLETVDYRMVSVPNGDLTSDTITNYSTAGNRRMDFDFNVAYASDIDKTEQILVETAVASGLILSDPAPFAYLAKQGDSSLTFRLCVWCKIENYRAVLYAMQQNVKKALDANGIEIPFNQLDVHFDNKQI